MSGAVDFQGAFSSLDNMTCIVEFIVLVRSCSDPPQVVPNPYAPCPPRRRSVRSSPYSGGDAGRSAVAELVTRPDAGNSGDPSFYSDSPFFNSGSPDVEGADYSSMGPHCGEYSGRCLKSQGFFHPVPGNLPGEGTTPLNACRAKTSGASTRYMGAREIRGFLMSTSPLRVWWGTGPTSRATARE